jgi:hypothetical protein
MHVIKNGHTEWLSHKLSPNFLTDLKQLGHHPVPIRERPAVRILVLR